MVSLPSMPQHGVTVKVRGASPQVAQQAHSPSPPRAPMSASASSMKMMLGARVRASSNSTWGRVEKGGRMWGGTSSYGGKPHGEVIPCPGVACVCAGWACQRGTAVRERWSCPRVAHLDHLLAVSAPLGHDAGGAHIEEGGPVGIAASAHHEIVGCRARQSGARGAALSDAMIIIQERSRRCCDAGLGPPHSTPTPPQSWGACTRLHCAAAAFASSVLPVPGGPYSSAPRQGVSSPLNSSGYLHSMVWIHA